MLQWLALDLAWCWLVTGLALLTTAAVLTGRARRVQHRQPTRPSVLVVVGWVT